MITSNMSQPPDSLINIIHNVVEDLLPILCHSDLCLVYRTADISALSRSSDSAEIYINCSVHKCELHSSIGTIDIDMQNFKRVSMNPTIKQLIKFNTTEDRKFHILSAYLSSRLVVCSYYYMKWY